MEDKSFQLLVLLSIFCIKIQSIYSVDNFYTSKRNNIYYLENEKKYSWFDALAKCVSMEMALATIDTKEKHEEITDLLRKTFDKVNSAWIGGAATGNDRQFVWISSGEKLNYTNWSPGEPSNGGDEYCLLTAWPPNLQWNDNGCHTHHGVICEYSHHYHKQKEMHTKLQEELAKEEELKNELEKNRLLLKLLLDYKISHKIHDKENNTSREIYINIY